MGREGVVSADSVGSIVRFAKRYAIAAGGALYAFTVGIGSPRNRHLIHDIARRFGHRDGDAPRLPTVALDELTCASTEVALAEPVARDGNVSLVELLVLARLVRERRPRHVFEIGTFDGRTTLSLAMNARDDAVVYTLDLPSEQPTELALERSERAFIEKPISGERFQGTDAARKIVQLYGDSATFDFTLFRAELVFVDGSHSYEYVLSDSLRALTLVGGRAGAIVWHDYSEWPGVTRALDHLASHDRRFADLRWVEGTTLAVLIVPAPLSS